MSDTKELGRNERRLPSRDTRSDAVGCSSGRASHVELVYKNAPKKEHRFGPSAEHQRAIAQLVLNGASTEKFGRAIRRLWREVQGPGNDAIEFMGRGGFCRIPDAYRIDKAAKVVTAYEVVVGSPISREKATDYYSLFWMLDEEHWTLDVVEVTEHGRMTRADILGRGIAIYREEEGLPPFTTAERFELKERTGIARDPIFDMAAPT